MREKTKMSIILVCFAAAAALILFYALDNAAKISQLNRETENGREIVDLAKLEAEYKSESRQIVKEYEEALFAAWPGISEAGEDDDNSLKAEKEVGLEADLAGLAASQKNRLLELTVPPALKDLHLKLVLAFDRAESDLEAKETAGLVESLTFIKEAKSEYPWLAQAISE